jgi:prolipoprotein diacylglyceryltransferase
MFPNLYYLFNELFGLNIPFLKVFQMFGFMMAMSFLAAYYAFSSEMKRKEKEGVLKPIVKTTTKAQAQKELQNDLLVSVVMGFVIGFKVLEALLNGNEFMDNPQSFILSTRGNLLGGIIMAAASGVYRFYQNKKVVLPDENGKKTQMHPYQLMGNFTVAAAVSGLIGAKIFHNLENWGEFMLDPWGNLFAFSGLTFYGGLLFGAITVLYLAKKNGIHWREMLDIGAPGMMLAYGVGRIGCHLSGDGDWGIVNTANKPGWLSWTPDWFWAYKYPHNVLREGVPIEGCEGEYCFELAQAVFPTPFYEAIACLGLFVLLWTLRKRIKIPGVLFGIYMILNGIERFLIEKIRVNNKMDFLGLELTQAEIISSTLVILGLAGIVYFTRFAKKLT